MVRKKPLTICPLVSVNLRTFNSAKTIEETLISVKKQTYRNLEIVVSDGHSRDGTIDFLKKYKCRIFYADKLGDARRKNVIESKGKFILSLDSDQTLSRNLIEKCVYYCEERNLDMLIIPERSYVDRGTYLERLIGYDKMLIDKGKDVNSIFGAACPRFFRREILIKMKWPKKLAIFDDAILFSRLLDHGAKVAYIKGVYIRHHEVKEWRVLFKKFFKYGQGYIRAFRARPETVSIHSLPRRAYFTSNALREPKYFFGLFLLYGVKVVSASLGALYFVLAKLVGKKI